MTKPLKEHIPANDLFRRMGFKTPFEKNIFHEEHKLPLVEAFQKPEFWVVNAITTGRLFAEAYSLYLTFAAVEKSQLILPAVLLTSSFLADFVDGELARKWNVCTDFGEQYDHGWVDKIWEVSTAFLVIRSMLF